MWTLLFSAAQAQPAMNPPAGSEPPAAQTAEPAEPPPPPARLAVDCKVPTEVLFDGVLYGEVRWPGRLEFDVPPGAHVVRVWVGGNPVDMEIETVSGEELLVLAGRTGVTVAESAAPPKALAAVDVSMRVVGIPAVQLRIDDERHVVKAGSDARFSLAPGSHKLSVRSADGTAVWSNGVLEVRGPAVVQLSEGRLPEVSGAAVFHAGT